MVSMVGSWRGRGGGLDGGESVHQWGASYGVGRFLRQGFVRGGPRIAAVANPGRNAGNMSFSLAVPCPASRRRRRQTGRVRWPPNRQPTSGVMKTGSTTNEKKQAVLT